MTLRASLGDAKSSLGDPYRGGRALANRTFNVALTNLEFQGKFRICIKPLLPVLPCIGGMNLMLVSEPYINYELRLKGSDGRWARLPLPLSPHRPLRARSTKPPFSLRRWLLIGYFPILITTPPCGTAYTGDLSILPGFLLYARTHARTHARSYRYTVVHHYRYAHVHRFRYAHVDESPQLHRTVSDNIT